MLRPDYIVGLVDGEGSFTVFIRDPNKLKTVKRRAKAEPRFYLKLVAKDKAVLFELKKFFGCGQVYFQQDLRANHQPCYRFEVASRKDLKTIIIPFFKKHHLKFKSKQVDFEIFCKIVSKIDQGVHLNKSGLISLLRLKAKMH